VIRRREFITALGSAAAWPLAAQGQSDTKVRNDRFSGSGYRFGRPTLALVQGLRELNWVESRNVAMEVRWAEGRRERAAEFAAEFVQRKVDIIVTWATGPTLVAKQATSVIPIVFALATDPV
jgi:putative ABC transport system substrate-binding protein